MAIKSLINMFLMQGLWFAAVIGAAKNEVLFAPSALLIFLIWQFRDVNRVTGDFKLILVALLIGLILDTTWIKLGWLEFACDWPCHSLAPAWILFLWVGFALTLNHSLAWLQSRLGLAACLGGLSSPLSYWSAAQLGAVKIIPSSWVWFMGIGVSWAIAVPLLLWLAQQLKQLEQRQQHV